METIFGCVKVNGRLDGDSFGCRITNVGLNLMHLSDMTLGFCLPLLNSNSQPTDKLLQPQQNPQGLGKGKCI